MFLRLAAVLTVLAMAAAFGRVITGCGIMIGFGRIVIWVFAFIS
jgi:hypothetical protein